MAYETFVDLAESLLTQNGTAATLTSVGNPVYDPALRQTVSPVTSHKCRAFLSPMGFPSVQRFSGFDQQDQVAMVAGKGLKVTPKPGDRLRVGSVSFAVKECSTTAPDGQTKILHMLRVGEI